MIIPPFSEIKSELLIKNIKELNGKYNVPGTSISIINKDTITTFSAGIADNIAKTELNDDTAMIYASLTKQLFSYIVHKMVEQNLIELDTPITSYLEKVYDQTEYINEITPAHVLSHIPGFPNWCYNRQLIQNNKPGMIFDYSGEGYIMLQKTLEDITKNSLQD